MLPWFVVRRLLPYGVAFAKIMLVPLAKRLSAGLRVLFFAEFSALRCRTSLALAWSSASLLFWWG